MVFIDAPSLVEEDYQRTGRRPAYAFADWKPIHAGPTEFLKAFASGTRISAVIHSEISVDSGCQRNTGTLLFCSVTSLSGEATVQSAGLCVRKGRFTRGSGWDIRIPSGRRLLVFFCRVLSLQLYSGRLLHLPEFQFAVIYK